MLGPIQGWLIDTLGPRAMMRAGFVLLGVGMMLFSQIDTQWNFFLFYFLMSLGASLAGFMTLTTAVVNWFERRRALAIAIMGIGMAIGGLLVPLVVLSLEELGWRETAFGSGGVADGGGAAALAGGADAAGGHGLAGRWGGPLDGDGRRRGVGRRGGCGGLYGAGGAADECVLVPLTGARIGAAGGGSGDGALGVVRERAAGLFVEHGRAGDRSDDGGADRGDAARRRAGAIAWRSG